MSKQAVSKSVHEIPETLVNFFKEIYHQDISEVEFLRSYKDYQGTWEIFEVNKQFIAQVLNGKLQDISTVGEERVRKEAFGRRARHVMQKADVPWKLAKIAVSKNPVNFYNPEHIANRDALNFIYYVKETLEKYRLFNEGRMSIEEYLRLSSYELGHLTKKQISVIKEYWLSQQNA